MRCRIPARLAKLRLEFEMTMADQYRLNAANCAQMAEAAENEPDKNRFKRMEAAWRALETRHLRGMQWVRRQDQKRRNAKNQRPARRRPTQHRWQRKT